MLMLPLGRTTNARLTHVERGFTLLEVLVVVAIIGVLTGIALSMMKFDRYEQTLRDKTDDFQQFYQAVQDEALLTGKALRLRFEKTQFVLERRQNGQWQAFAIDDKNSVQFAQPFNVGLTPKTPLIFLPSGQSKPFQLDVEIDAYQQRIAGDAMGKLTVTTE